MSRNADSGSDEWSDMFESNGPGWASNLGDSASFWSNLSINGMDSDRSLPLSSFKRRETLGKLNQCD